MHFFQGVSIVRIGGQDDNCRGSVWIIFHNFPDNAIDDVPQDKEHKDRERYVRHYEHNQSLFTNIVIYLIDQ